MKNNKTNKFFWERTAVFYKSFMSKNNTAYNKICRILNKYINKSSDILELACGTGQITYRIAKHSHSWKATDYSENMIKEAVKGKGSQHKNIYFEVQDATRLTYSDNSFNVVVIANALHIMPDPDKALKEIHRVLKNDGILFAPTFVYNGKQNIIKQKLMQLLGFKTYNKWKAEEYLDYVVKRGFKLKEQKIINGFPYKECILVCKKA